MTRYVAALGLALTAAPALALDPSEVVTSPNPQVRAVMDRYGYSEAVVAAGLIHLSGIAVGRQGDEPLDAAFARALRHAAAVLGRAGGGLDDVVEITSYHKGDVAPQVEALSRAKAKAIPGPAHPAWTAIGVAGLLDPGAIAEIRLVARTRAAAGATAIKN